MEYSAELNQAKTDIDMLRELDGIDDASLEQKVLQRDNYKD